jgi:hypothetical protein
MAVVRVKLHNPNDRYDFFIMSTCVRSQCELDAEIEKELLNHPDTYVVDKPVHYGRAFE